MLDVAEEAPYEGLTKTDQSMVDAVDQISLADTPLAAPMGNHITFVDMSPSTDTQDKSTTPEIDATQTKQLFRHDTFLPPSLSHLYLTFG